MARERRGGTLEMTLHAVEAGPPEDGYEPVRLVTSRGDVHGRYYRADGATRGAVWVGGAGGGWDTPAQGLYPRLCQEFAADGIASLRVRFRNSHSLEEATLDVLMGAAYLQSQGVDALALTGHSLGGAVVIQAAAATPAVRTVVALATQSYGAEPAGRLGPRCSLLLIHGLADKILPARCSEHVHQLAHEPKRLVLHPGGRHVLDEVEPQVYDAVREWIPAQLRRDT